MPVMRQQLTGVPLLDDFAIGQCSLQPAHTGRRDVRFLETQNSKVSEQDQVSQPFVSHFCSVEIQLLKISEVSQILQSCVGNRSPFRTDRAPRDVQFLEIRQFLQVFETSIGDSGQPTEVDEFETCQLGRCSSCPSTTGESRRSSEIGSPLSFNSIRA
jgi:hypothetical protein